MLFSYYWQMVRCCEITSKRFTRYQVVRHILIIFCCYCQMVYPSMQDQTNSDQLVRQGQDAPRLPQGVGSTLLRIQ